jgi:L,D-peptidoglycan transpeptidase YkuD (ErfK/YbiS/YcfS/YnhG family)
LKKWRLSIKLFKKELNPLVEKNKSFTIKGNCKTFCRARMIPRQKHSGTSLSGIHDFKQSQTGFPPRNIAGITCWVFCNYLFFLSLITFLTFAEISAAFAIDTNTIFALLKNIPDESSQILLVTNSNPSSFAVKIYVLAKQNGKWENALKPINGVIGKNSFAELGKKREGDGRTPSGIFSIERTFGYAESISTKMPYRQALPDDLWIDDVNAGDYNRWAKAGETRAKSYEGMKRDDNLYKYGIVIEYNTNPVVKGYGSAIFFHVWAAEEKPTAGCVAVEENAVIKILEWLDPAAKPMIIMGTEDTVGKLLQ